MQPATPDNTPGNDEQSQTSPGAGGRPVDAALETMTTGDEPSSNHDNADEATASTSADGDGSRPSAIDELLAELLVDSPSEPADGGPIAPTADQTSGPPAGEMSDHADTGPSPTDHTDTGPGAATDQAEAELSEEPGAGSGRDGADLTAEPEAESGHPTLTEPMGEQATGSPRAEVESGTAPDPTAELATRDSGGVAAVEPAAVRPGATPRHRRRRLRRSIEVVAVLGLVALGLLAVAWGLDTARHTDRALRNVYIGDANVGGLDRTEIAAVIDEQTAELGRQPLTVIVGDTTIESDPVTLGLRLNTELMANEALLARRSQPLAIRPFAWIGSLFGRHTLPNRYEVDTELAVAAADDVVIAELDQPVEPEMSLEGSQLVVSPGQDGITIEPRELIGRLPVAIEAGRPYELELAVKEAEPTLDAVALQALADEINEQTSEPILVQVLDQQVQIESRLQRSWIALVDDGADLGWEVDSEQAIADLRPLFPSLGEEDQQAKFRVVDEKPIVIPGSETVICCEADSGRELTRIINRPVTASAPDTADGEAGDQEQPALRTAILEPVITGFDEGVAELESLGIVELVSTFTTEHACCQNRVENIQRFADLMQGVVIRPDEELSLNEHVGRRTRENGFVADGAIVQGNFEPQVGGGISQYATTFFNASFFAGLEFLEYQSHSIYISRYPRGREATISWRKPDLRVRNNTDYGILVWNEYTPTSITVSFYSTKHLSVEALPLRRSSDRQCRIDITPRVITHPDGTQIEDSVFAVYRPGEGLDCNGNSTRPPEDEAG